MRLLVVLLTLATAALGIERPNFLIIVGDDCTYNDLPLYGGENAKTPNLDALAQRGLTFDQAYLSSAMCQPCRAELYTGQYPIRNGCAWNHSACRPETTSLPQHLRPHGYRVGISGKVHVKPAASFPFDPVAGFDPSCVRNPTKPHDLGEVTTYMKADEPFCLVIGLVEPHVPWVMGDASAYPPKKLKLPPNIADTEDTRNSFSRYLAEITYMDGQVGEILAALDATGKAEETIVLFTSEQGSQFPGCKWTTWNTGLHTALIAVGPGVPKGERTSGIVQYADIAPTLLEIAGGELSEQEYDGVSFRSLLLGEGEGSRKFAFGIHNNVPEGPPYPTRAITDGEFRYVRNLSPDRIYIEKHLMGGGGKALKRYWPSWTGAGPDDERTYNLISRYMSRPAESLYHTESDPYEMVDLSENPEYEEVKARLSTELDQWMSAQGDPGVPVDTMNALEAARGGKHSHGVSQ